MQPAHEVKGSGQEGTEGTVIPILELCRGLKWRGSPRDAGHRFWPGAQAEVTDDTRPGHGPGHRLGSQVTSFSARGRGTSPILQRTLQK